MKWFEDTRIRNNFPVDIPEHTKNKMIRRSLYNPKNWDIFMEWWSSHLKAEDMGGPLDPSAALDEVDRTLELEEAINLMKSKHPDWFIDDRHSFADLKGTLSLSGKYSKMQIAAIKAWATMWLDKGEVDKAQLALSVVEQVERDKPKIHPKPNELKKTMPIPK